MASRIAVTLSQQVLDAFARDIGAGPHKTVVLVLDNAGWHISKKLRPPDGIRFCFLPPYAPALHPAEHLRPLTNEGIANRPFDSLDHLSECLDQRCAALSDQPDIISRNTNFHWWPKETCCIGIIATG